MACNARFPHTEALSIWAVSALPLSGELDEIELVHVAVRAQMKAGVDVRLTRGAMLTGQAVGPTLDGLCVLMEEHVVWFLIERTLPAITKAASAEARQLQGSDRDDAISHALDTVLIREDVLAFDHCKSTLVGHLIARAKYRVRNYRRKATQQRRILDRWLVRVDYSVRRHDSSGDHGDGERYHGSVDIDDDPAWPAIANEQFASLVQLLGSERMTTLLEYETDGSRKTDAERQKIARIRAIVRKHLEV